MTYLHRSIPAASVKLFLKYKVLYMNEYNDDNLKLCTLNYLSVTASPEGLRQDQERSLQWLLLPHKNGGNFSFK